MFQKRLYQQILGLVLVFAMLFCAVPAVTAQASTLGKVTLKSVAATSKSKIKVKWKKLSKAAGYQVKISKDKSGKNIVYNKNTTKNTITTGTLSARTYYVKVRAYRTVNGTKAYGSWSTVKKVKVTASQTASEDTGSGSSASGNSAIVNEIGTVPNTIAVDKDALVSTYELYPLSRTFLNFSAHKFGQPFPMSP